MEMLCFWLGQAKIVYYWYFSFNDATYANGQTLFYVYACMVAILLMVHEIDFKKLKMYISVKFLFWNMIC